MRTRRKSTRTHQQPDRRSELEFYESNDQPRNSVKRRRIERPVCALQRRLSLIEAREKTAVQEPTPEGDSVYQSRSGSDAEKEVYEDEDEDMIDEAQWNLSLRDDPPMSEYELRELLADMKQIKADLKANSHDAKADIMRLKMDMENKLKSREDENSRLLSEIRTAKIDIGRLESSVKNLEASMKIEEGKVADTQTQFAAYKNAMQRAFLDLESRLKGAVKRYHDRSHAIAAMEAKIGTLALLPCKKPEVEIESGRASSCSSSNDDMTTLRTPEVVSQYTNLQEVSNLQAKLAGSQEDILRMQERLTAYDNRLLQYESRTIEAPSIPVHNDCEKLISHSAHFQQQMLHQIFQIQDATLQAWRTASARYSSQELALDKIQGWIVEHATTSSELSQINKFSEQQDDKQPRPSHQQCIQDTALLTNLQTRMNDFDLTLQSLDTHTQHSLAKANSALDLVGRHKKAVTRRFEDVWTALNDVGTAPAPGLSSGRGVAENPLERMMGSGLLVNGNQDVSGGGLHRKTLQQQSQSQSRRRRDLGL